MRPASKRGDEAGSVELVIVFPVALMVILLIVQAGLWFLARSTAHDAAVDGARAAAAAGASAAAGRMAASSALGQLAGPVLANPTVTAARTAQTSQVTVTGRTEAILPGLSLPVTATVSLPTESFRP